MTESEPRQRYGESYGRVYLVDELTDALAVARAQGVREGIEKAAQAIRQLDTPATLTNAWAFGWEHCRYKVIFTIHALAATEPQEESDG